jgi:hypothetical protein
MMYSYAVNIILTYVVARRSPNYGRRAACDQFLIIVILNKRRQIPRILVRKRTIPTDQPPLVSQVSADFCGYVSVAWSAQRVPTTVNLIHVPLSYPREAEWTPFQTK